MIRDYVIVPGNNGKENIHYYEDNVLVTTELYSQPGFTAEIKPGYINRNRIKWAEMLSDLFTPGGAIITKMRATAKASVSMAVEFSTITTVMQNGANGFPDEATLQTLLRLNWNFTAGEKTTINNYLANNNFSITVT